MTDFLNRLMEVDPEKIAYICGDDKVSYGELLAESKKIAAALRDSKKPVAVKGHKEPYMLSSFVACLMAGRAYIPCDISMPDSRIAYITEKADAESITDLQPHVSEKEFAEFSGNEDDTAYIVFTSGSSGEPKGVPISRRNLRTFIEWITSSDVLKECAGKTVLNQARFSFDLSVADIYFSLSTGSTLVALSEQDQAEPERLMTAMQKADPTLAVMTPTFAKYCLQMPEFRKDNMPSLSCIFFCGEILEPKTVKGLYERFPGIHVINAYGPTEATCAVCAAEISEEMLCDEFLPCGVVEKADCAVTVKDGEIMLCGSSVFRGYLGGDKLCEAYATGDRGEIRNGLLYCFGRKYGYIKYKGHRIELDEIKNIILRIDGVEQCSVKTIESGNRIMGISAQVVSSVLTADDVKRKAAEFLPPYMIPKTVKIKETVSFNANGKQDF